MSIGPVWRAPDGTTYLSVPYPAAPIIDVDPTVQALVAEARQQLRALQAPQQAEDGVTAPAPLTEDDRQELAVLRAEHELHLSPMGEAAGSGTAAAVVAAPVRLSVGQGTSRSVPVAPKQRQPRPPACNPSAVSPGSGGRRSRSGVADRGAAPKVSLTADRSDRQSPAGLRARAQRAVAAPRRRGLCAARRVRAHADGAPLLPSAGVSLVEPRPIHLLLNLPHPQDGGAEVVVGTPEHLPHGLMR